MDYHRTCDYVLGMRILITTLLLLMLTSSCHINTSGLTLAPGWVYHSLGAWKHLAPGNITRSKTAQWLYFASETTIDHPAAVMKLNVASGHSQMLLQGFRHIRTLRIAPDHSLWISEGEPHGTIWRIAEPDTFPEEQIINPISLESTHSAVAPFLQAGHNGYQAITFSRNEKYAYMVSQGERSHLYRLTLATRKLTILNRESTWEATNDEASKAPSDAQIFSRLHDIETLPDGRLLLLEAGDARIMQLADLGSTAKLSEWLHMQQLHDAIDMAWDTSRGWLWICRSNTPSTLQAWDGHKLRQIVQHPRTTIRAVMTDDDHIYVSLHRSDTTPALIFTLSEKAASPSSLQP